MSRAAVDEVAGTTGSGGAEEVAVHMGGNAGRSGDVRLSRRDVSDGALRILRVAGVPSGEAKRAAGTVEHLQIHRGSGCASLIAALDRGALAADPLTPTRSGERTWQLDAAGRSGVVLATRVGDLLRLHGGPAATIVHLPGLLEPSALEPMMLQIAAAGMSVVADWPAGDDVDADAEGAHEVVVALPTAGAATSEGTSSDAAAGPSLARIALPRPSCLRRAADDGRPPTVAELSTGMHDGGASGEAVLIAVASEDVTDLGPARLLGAGFTVESAVDLATRLSHATRHGLRLPAPLWQRFQREAARWLVPDA